MSDISLEPIKEQLLYDHMDIIDINQLENEINYFHKLFNIYKGEKINSNKIGNTSKLNVSYSSKISTETKIEDREQIDEVKYNIFFII